MFYEPLKLKVILHLNFFNIIPIIMLATIYIYIYVIYVCIYYFDMFTYIYAY